MNRVYWCVGVVLMVSTSLAWASHIYKCVNQQGRVVYQDARCEGQHDETQISIRSPGDVDATEDSEANDSVDELVRKADRQLLERKISRVDAKIESLEKRIAAIEERRNRGGSQKLREELEQLRTDQARGRWRPSVSRFLRWGVQDAIIKVEDQIAKEIRDGHEKEARLRKSIEELSEERRRLEKQLAKLE